MQLSWVTCLCPPHLPSIGRRSSPCVAPRPKQERLPPTPPAPCPALPPVMDAHPSRKLVKKARGPPISFHNNLRNHSLQRAPSAPTYPSFHAQRTADPAQAARALARDDAPQPEPSPPLRRQTSNPAISLSAPSAASSSHSLRTTPELVGAPFDAAAINKSISATIATQRPPLAHAHSRPSDHHAPPQHPKKKPAKSPKLRQSASFTLARKMNDTITPPRSDGGTKSPRQRYSDEADAAHSKNRKSDAGKKKGAFSSFMNSMLGSPRRPTISTPTNPMHVTHVSIDNETGEFTVRAPPSPLRVLLCSLTPSPPLPSSLR